MHDFDVGAISLSVPPASAVIQSYRPAVLVRNNGVHDALASGSLRIYSPAGLLIFTTEVYSGTIAPGETAPAQAVAYWTPPALGRYMFIAYVSCINDQYENNNSLAPCFVDVIPGEPLPPSAVPLHAAQHEEGGQDELNIDGLHGRATDSQTPLAHKTSHQVAGSDTLDLTGMLGVLGTPQPIADHHETHENSGGDELNVEGLYGVLENLQKPKVHANEAHDPNFSAKPHGNADHVPDFCPLDSGDMVSPSYLGTGATATGVFLSSDQEFKEVPITLLYANDTNLNLSDGDSHTIFTVVDDPRPDGTIFELLCHALLTSTMLGNTLTITVLAGVSALDLAPVVTHIIPITPGAINRNAICRSAIQILSGNCGGLGDGIDDMGLLPRSYLPTMALKALSQLGIHIRLTAKLTSAVASTICTLETAVLRRRLPD